VLVAGGDRDRGSPGYRGMEDLPESCLFADRAAVGNPARDHVREGRHLIRGGSQR
jgi:hypothetical protein